MDIMIETMNELVEHKVSDLEHSHGCSAGYYYCDAPDESHKGWAWSGPFSTAEEAETAGIAFFKELEEEFTR